MIKRNHLTATALGTILALSVGIGTAFAETYETGDRPDANQTTQTSPGAGDSTRKSGKLEGVTEKNADLSQFVEAVEAAGMAESLTGSTSYTVFAPTNEALEASGDGEGLTEKANRNKLASLLRAHIVADDVDPEMAAKIGAAKTVDGSQVTLKADGEELEVGDARVVGENIQVGNLRIYPIDQVLEAGSAGSLASRTSQSMPSDSGSDEEEAEE